MGNRNESAKAAKQREAEPYSESEESDDDVLEDLIDIPKNYNMKKNRQSVSAEVYGAHNVKGNFKAPVHKKTLEQSERIWNTINSSFLFNSLEENDLNTVINAFQEKHVSADEVIIEQGEDGDCLYLLEKGECNVYKQMPGESEAKLVFTQKPGDAFGELALLYNCPRAATVKAKEDVVLWSLDRESFNHIVKDAASRKRELHEDFLKKVDLLKDMDSYERSKVADALKTIYFKKDDVVIKEGDNGDRFYIIEKGSAEARQGETKVLSYGEGNYFGELALIKDQPRAATVVATSDVKLVSLDRRSFKRLLGSVEGLLKRNAKRYTKFQKHLSKHL